MTHTGWPAAAGLMVLALLWLWLPGGSVIRVLGLRGLAWWGLAPAASVGVLGAGAVVTGAVGRDWGPLSALQSTALVLAVAVLLRRHGVYVRDDAGRTWYRSRGRGVLLTAATAVSAVAVLAPVVRGMPSADAVLQRWDSVFHLNALRLIEEKGSGSTLVVGAVSSGADQPRFYPAGWHDLAALLPGSSLTAALNVTSAATTVLPWVLGCALLATRIWRDTPFVAPVAALAAACTTAVPSTIWVGFAHLPNALGLALLPAVLALVVDVVGSARDRRALAVVLLICVAGLSLAHPNATLALGVLVTPLLFGRLLGSSRRSWQEGRRSHAWVTPALVMLVGAAAVVAVLVSPVGHMVAGYVHGGRSSTTDALRTTVYGTLPSWPLYANAVVSVGALVGAVLLAVTRRRLWPGVAYALVVLLYLDAAAAWPVGASALWYRSAVRLGALTSVLAVPLAAGAAVTLVDLPGRLLRVPARVTGAIALTAVLGFTLVLTARTADYRTERTRDVYQPAVDDQPRFLDAGESAMLGRLPRELDRRGAVLGNPFSGAPLLYGVFGQPVTFRVASGSSTADQQYVVAHLGALRTDPRVCATLHRLGIRYLYQDQRPYQRSAGDRLDHVVVPGAVTVDSGGTARVLELPACSGR